MNFSRFVGQKNQDTKLVTFLCTFNKQSKNEKRNDSTYKSITKNTEE
jgi:hypothetical protein